MALTKKDLQMIGEVIDSKFEKFDEKVDDKFTQLKSDFYDKIDPVLNETLANREERIINDNNIADLRSRVAVLETGN